MKRFSFHQTEGITCLGGFCRGFSGIISEKTGREENKEKNAKTNDRIGGKQSQLLAVYHHFYPPKKNLLFYIRGFFFLSPQKKLVGHVSSCRCETVIIFFSSYMAIDRLFSFSFLIEIK